MGRFESKFDGFPGQALIRDATEGSGSSSIQPVGCTPLCSTDAVCGVACRRCNDICDSKLRP